MAGYSDVTVFRRLLAESRHSWPSIGGLFLLSLLSSPLALLTPLPLRIAIDSVIGSHPLPGLVAPFVPDAIARSPAALLAFVVALLLTIALLSQLQVMAVTLLGTFINERLVLGFRARLFHHAQRISLAYHDTRGTADTTYRIQHEAPAIQNIVTGGVIPLITATATFVGMLYVMAMIDWPLALIALGMSPGLLVAARVFKPRLRRRSREVRGLDSFALGIVPEVLGALRIVKSFGQEAREKDRFVGRSREAMRARLRLAGLEGGYQVFAGMTTAIGTAAVLLIGVGHVLGGLLTLGALLMVMGYLTQLYEPLRMISRKSATLQLHFASAERAFALLDEPLDVEQRPAARPLARAAGAIAFKNVSFAYGPERPVLHDISFSIEPGTSLGIIGASGAGKSTLISLLIRFYDPTAGSIQLDGSDLRDFRLDDLRRQFAVVTQDPVLFSTTVGENIAYARPGADQEDLIAAAQAANAHEFIVRLPHGYDTQVGERGVQLSGGQRQRIAIARAFLTDSPVLILDEPTSAVDAAAEAAIVEAIRRLMRGRTVVLITHRSSLLQSCTSLVALENGRLVSDATRAPTMPTSAGPVSARKRQTTLLSHPAVRAWRQLYPESEPDRITPLRLFPPKTSVYRLEGADPAGAAVVAKRSRKADAQIERAVYEEILPRLRIPSLRYYGSVEDSDVAFSWTFLEEATGARYSRLLAAHRDEAAHWLGLLHTAATEAGARDGLLPEAGPNRYRKLLRAAREGIPRHLGNPVLTADEVECLENVVIGLTELEARWTGIEEVCASGPATLVHGDFNGKNVRLRSTSDGITLLVFDWEDAGWGVPAVDLAQQIVPSSSLSASPDLPTYWATVRDSWPEMSAATLERVAYCGTIFRALAALNWELASLGTEWASNYVANLRLYEAEWSEALSRIDGRSASGSAADLITAGRS